MSQLTAGGQQFPKHSWDSWAVLFQGEQKGGCVREVAWTLQTSDFEGAVPESPRSYNRNSQPKTWGSRNLQLRVVCVIKGPSKGQNVPPISALPASMLVKGQRACTVLQRRDIQGPWATVEGVTEQDGQVIASCLCGSRGRFFF